jgi:type IV pilus assembly protein PilY1
MKAVNLFKILLFVFVIVGIRTAPTQAQTLSDYSALPPFLGNVLTPNVLILMDNSGSMDSSAYHNNDEGYDSTREYGGYFDNTRCYTYGSGKFTVTTGAPPSCGTTWDGNFLNYLVASRIEITKYVMMGGKCSARTASGTCLPGGTIVFDSTDRVPDIQSSATGRTPYTGTRCFQRSGRTLNVRSGSSCSSGSTTSFDLEVVPVTEPTGVIQQVGNKARFGLMEFKGSGDGGKVLADVGSTPLVNNSTCSGSNLPIINAIECTAATTWTPLAESLYEATRYFAQIAPAYSSSDYSYTTQSRDPFYFTSPTWSTTAQYVTCCKSFVILFTDGQPTQDLNIPDSIKGYASDFYQTPSHCAPPGGCTSDHSTSSHNHSTVSNHFDNCSIYYGGTSSDSCVWYGSHYLDDVAYWAHTTDLRPSTGNIAGINATPNSNRLEGMQNLNIYTFFAFGTGSNILQASAKMGGFVDLDGDGEPYSDITCGTASPNAMCKEWDKDGDGVADTYFESSDAFALRERLMATITDILQKSASGTSVSVLATSSSGEGAIYQAYFYPSVFEGLEQISWLGYLQGLFFDTQGQLREDTNGDGKLVLNEDKIVETFFDSTALETRVRRYSVDSDGNSTGTAEVIGLKEMKPIWEAGKKLAVRDLSANPRTIKTWVDSDNDGAVDAGEFIDFAAANESTLRRYLRAANSTEGTNIINFIRGDTVSGYRNRNVTVDGNSRTWRLGDIIYSSPISVGSPADRFDLKNQDESYNEFYNKYKDRRHVVYVGANDGMLHAFNGGFFHQGDDPSTANAVEHGWFTTDSNPLGQELWAFVPQELLPHLKWLTGTDYDSSQHVYYVDGTPRIVDAQIFTPDAVCATDLNDAGCVHPSGWGTVLIGSMRLGGGLLKTDLNGDGDTTDSGEDRFRSVYFAMDITDPEAAPTLLWVFKDPDLGFTTSWPSIMRFNSTTWYLTFGSGPLSYRGERDKTNSPTSTNNKFESTVSEYGQIYAVNLKTGALVRKFTLTDRYAFMGDSTVYDMPLNYVSDVLYIGETFYNRTTSQWTGKMYRLLTYGSSDATTWVLSTLYNPDKPITVKPTATMDKNNRLWLYFGTGRFFSGGANSDQSDTSPQAMYGIKESGPNGCWNGATWRTNCSNTIPSTTGTLFDATAASVSVGGACTGCGTASTLTGLIGGVINSSVNEKEGWVINLSGGERVIVESTVLGGIVAATTYTPDTDVCASQGTNTLYAMYFESGTAYSGSVIGTTGSTVNRTMSLGRGVASKVNVVVSDETTTGFVQSSTGQIVQIEGITLASNVRSGKRVFRDKAD